MKVSNLKYIPLVLLGMVGGWSCSNESSDIGSAFFQNHSSVLVLDTVTVGLSTVYLDSVITSGTGTVLTGAFSDTIGGARQASSYLELGSPVPLTPPSGAVYDSLYLLLKPNHYFAGDSTQNFSFSVNQLTQLINPGTNQNYLYNTSSFNYNPTPLGTWTGRIYPTITDTLSVRLSDQLGNNIFSAMVNNPSSLSPSNSFINNYLNGLVITSAGMGDRAVYGFKMNDSSAVMRIYYHNPQDVKTAMFSTFIPVNTNLQFNHVDADRSATPLNNISSKNKVVTAAQSGNRSVLQPLSNLAIGLSFPYLQNLQYLGRYVKILNAQLILKPIPGTYSNTAPLPPALSLCEVQNYYGVLDSLVSSGGIQHGQLVADYAYNNSYYTYDITQYLLRQMSAANNNNKTSLLLIPPYPAYNTTFQRLALGGPGSANNGIQLTVQVVVYSLQ